MLDIKTNAKKIFKAMWNYNAEQKMRFMYVWLILLFFPIGAGLFSFSYGFPVTYGLFAYTMLIYLMHKIISNSNARGLKRIRNGFGSLFLTFYGIICSSITALSALFELMLWMQKW